MRLRADSSSQTHISLSDSRSRILILVESPAAPRSFSAFRILTAKSKVENFFAACLALSTSEGWHIPSSIKRWTDLVVWSFKRDNSFIHIY